VVAYGPSLHDSDSYYLMRAYAVMLLWQSAVDEVEFEQEIRRSGALVLKTKKLLTSYPPAQDRRL